MVEAIQYRVLDSKFSAAGTVLSRLFSLEHNGFKVVSCKNCGYSEFFRVKGSAVKNIIELLFGR